MDILITGGAGFIGSHLSNELNKNGENVIVIDDLSTGKRDNLEENITLIEGDISDQTLVDSVFDKYDFEYIFHFAAIASVQHSVDFPEETNKVNLQSTFYLLNKARKIKNLKRFVFASSAAIFGNTKELPINENNTINPLTPYGIEKYASEKYALIYEDLYNVPVTIFRFFNVFGPRQNPSSPYSGVISLINNSFIMSSDFSVFGDGEQTRDFIYITDLITLINKITFSNYKKGNNIFNLGTGKETSINDLLNIFSKVSGKRINIKYKTSREGDILKSYCDNQKVLKETKHTFMTIEEAIKDYWGHN